MAFSIHPAVGDRFFMDEMCGRLLLLHGHTGAVKSDGHEGSMGGGLSDGGSRRVVGWRWNDQEWD